MGTFQVLVVWDRGGWGGGWGTGVMSLPFGVGLARTWSRVWFGFFELELELESHRSHDKLRRKKRTNFVNQVGEYCYHNATAAAWKHYFEPVLMSS